jgi:vesicle-fusing ATPase
VAGPSILNKYVGESEKAIRDLFEDAEKEEEEKGENSQLHVIIFDEIDAICKQRGTDKSGSGVHDSLVNQLLSKIDGVNELNNILVIGMTNRKDMLDNALLRAGRLEIHIEIGLPDEKGRVQILGIHTAKLKEANKLASDVSVEKLATRTKNFTGAEIKSLCVRASQNMLARLVDMKTYRIENNALATAKVTNQDFDLALEGMTPMFAVRDDELKALFHNGIVEHSKDFENVASRLQSCADQVRKSERTRVLPILIQGKPGSGKTAFSAWSAVQSGFPFKKRICAADMLGMGPGQKVAYIDSVFQEAYKTPLSCIVLDDLERLVEYVPLGKSYNPHVLNSLLVLVSKPPPDRTRRLLVLATTSNVQLLDVLGLRQNFMQEIELPLLRNEGALKFLDQETKIRKDRMMEIVGTIKQPVPVKMMLNIIEFSRQDVDGRDEDITTAGFMACMSSVLGTSELSF